MGLVTDIVQFIAGTPALASEVNANFDAIVSTLNGQIEDVNVSELSASKIGSGEFDVARIPNLPASRITSGVFHEDRIPAITVDKVPNLPASKVTSGAFSADRIPNLSANKITSGTLPVSRGGTGRTSWGAFGRYVRVAEDGGLQDVSPSTVLSAIGAAPSSHNHAASAITSGTFDSARIPNLSADKITSGSMSASRIGSGTLSADRIPNLSAAKITSGTMSAARVSGVVTTSGNQSISGTKTFTGNLVLPVR